MRLEKHNQVVLSKHETVSSGTPRTKGTILLLVCQVKTVCKGCSLCRSIMSFYSLYNTSKEAYIFLHSFLNTTSSFSRALRRTQSLEQKSLPSTPDARDRDEGVPNPWFTGPPPKSFKYSSKNEKVVMDFINEQETDTFRRVH